jgi:hypothetical protein
VRKTIALYSGNFEKRAFICKEKNHTFHC